MARKVLISFLGKNKYDLSKYYFDNDRNDISEPVCYVQEFILRRFCNDWAESDYAFFVTTKDTIENNWLNRAAGSFGKPEIEENKGLKSVVEQLRNENIIKLQYDNIKIEDGDDAGQIWQIFSQIEKKLLEVTNENEEVEIYMDVTYSFRYLPMIGIILLSYLSVFRNLKVQKILYGNYEKGKIDNNESPVIDLTSFVELQNWAKISDEFVNLGESNNFSKVNQHTELSQKLNDLVAAIRTSRGGDLIFNFDFDKLKTLINQAKNEKSAQQQQLANVLNKIEDSIKNFNKEDIKNGFNAVEWCIKYKLVPQGYTLLQETIITWLLSQFLSTDKLLDYNFRKLTVYPLNGIPKYETDQNGNFILDENGKKKKNWKSNVSLIQEMTNKVASMPEIVPLYKRLTGNHGLRNDINHGGFKENAASPEQLTKELEKIYKEFKTLIFP
jgi:CRISPR-associated Csx2 family protein